MLTDVTDLQERIRRFNEDEAVWQRFEQKRNVRRLLGSPLDVPEEILDEIDWREAECEVRQTRCIGVLVE